jgi:uncharacterized membrane protein
MTKTIQISIPIPCHEGWENMAPADKGRFCSSCQKTVIDFTNLSDREIATAFKNDKNACGRFLNSQLQRDLIIPKEKNSLWLAASTAVVSFLTIGNHAVSAQAPVNTEQTENKTDDIKSRDTAQDTEKTITWTVLDEAGIPLPGAYILIQGKETSTKTDFEGKFSITASENDIIVIAYIGYETAEFPVGNKKNILIALVPDNIVYDNIAVGGAMAVQRTFFGRIFYSIGSWFR